MTATGAAVRIFGVIVLLGLLTGVSQAMPGVTADRVLFGQSAAIDGPAAPLGRGMQLGIQAAFAEANRRGGVHGRRLELLTYDDRYEPEAAIQNTTRLIFDDEVFALIGEVGTPTSGAAEPIATAASVPFIGAFTGAELLREPFRPTVINVRASYFQETEAMVERLTTDLGIRNIAVLYQDDSFGRAGLAGVRRALNARAMGLVSEGTYRRNTIAVKGALLSIRRGDPEAVIIIGTHLPAAAFIRWARKLAMDPVFVNISFVGSNALVAELGREGEGVVITQVVPFPEDTTLPLVARYQSALAVVAPEAAPGFVSLEGYVVGRLAIATLQRVGPEPTRERFVAALRSGDSYDIDGLVLDYGLADNQGMDTVFLTAIAPDGSIVPIEHLRRP